MITTVRRRDFSFIFQGELLTARGFVESKSNDTDTDRFISFNWFCDFLSHETDLGDDKEFFKKIVISRFKATVVDGQGFESFDVWLLKPAFLFDLL